MKQRQAQAVPLAGPRIDSLADIRDRLHRARTDAVPDGWLTADQWAERLRTPKYTMQRYLRMSVDAGLAEMRTFALPFANGIRQVYHYRFLEKDAVPCAAKSVHS